MRKTTMAQDAAVAGHLAGASTNHQMQSRSQIKAQHHIVVARDLHDRHSGREGLQLADRQLHARVGVNDGGATKEAAEGQRRTASRRDLVGGDKGRGDAADSSARIHQQFCSHTRNVTLDIEQGVYVVEIGRGENSIDLRLHQPNRHNAGHCECGL
jgi:hypothetical protein